MATESVTAADDTLTAHQEFCEMSERNLFAVVGGVPVNSALSHAACMVDALREIAMHGVGGGGISERQAWMMEANLETVYGLLTSIESAVCRRGRPA